MSRELVDERFRTMFDLENGPICKGTLIRLSPERTVFFLVIHHILSDAWSREVMEKELMTMYEAFAKGQENPLKPLRFQYRDFGSWYNRRIKNDNSTDIKSFWHSMFSLPLPESNLPMDFPENRRAGSYRELLLEDTCEMFRPLNEEEQEHFFGLLVSARSVKGAKYQFVLPEKINNLLLGLARTTDTSFFAVMSACLDVFFYRLTGKADSMTGTMVATRTHKALEGMLGYFMNTMIYRTVIDPSLRFGDYIKSVGDTISNALTHREYPLERLLSEFDVSLDTAGSLFLNFYKVDDQDSMITDFEARHEAVDHVYFDMDLNIGEFPNGIQIECNYNRELFKKETIERTFQNFAAFVVDIAHNLEAKIAGVKRNGVPK